MERLIIFILSTGSLSWIVRYGSIFKPLRERISRKHADYNDSDPNSLIQKYYWFIDSIINCVGCFGVYSGLFFYLILYRTISLDIIAYSLSGAIISLILNKLHR